MFCTSVAKVLKLKIKTFWDVTPIFAENIGEKLLGGGLFARPPILNRVKRNCIFCLVVFVSIGWFLKSRHFSYQQNQTETYV